MGFDKTSKMTSDNSATQKQKMNSGKEKFASDFTCGKGVQILEFACG